MRPPALPAHRNIFLSQAPRLFFFTVAIIGLIALWQTPSRAADLPISRIADLRLVPRDTPVTAVKVRGVVTWVDGFGGKTFAVADESAGIYVEAFRALESGVWKGGTELLASLAMGQEIELDGELRAQGTYAPVIRPSMLRVLRSNLPLKAPKVSVNRLLAGAEDSQRVEVRGVVQSSRPDPHNPSRRLLRCQGPAGFFLIVADSEPWSAPQRIVDAKVVARGLAMTLFNSRFQATGSRLSVRRAEDLIIETPPPADPFESPVLRPDNLRRFTGDQPIRNRQVFEGTVTYADPEKIFIQDKNFHVRVAGAIPRELRPGDRVLCAGFVELRRPVASIHDALVRKIGTAALPVPEVTTPENILRNNRDHTWRGWESLPVDYDGRLVALEGRLIALQPLESTAAKVAEVTIQTESGLPIRALLPPGGVPYGAEMPGCLLRLTGIAIIDYEPADRIPEFQEPSGVELLLREKNDVAILQPAPFWTPVRLATMLAVALSTGLVLWLWTLALRSHLRKRADETAKLIERGARHNAVIEERNRLATELHDGVQQLISGISMHVEAARHHLPTESAPGGASLNTAHHLLVRLRDEIRRSIWALRDLEVGNADLVKGLNSLMDTQRLCSDASLTLKAYGEPPRGLSRATSSSLLLVAQEAIANAVKHGNASNVRIALHQEPDGVTLAIYDDGSGFDCVQAKADSASKGQIGLSSMRHRLARLGGSLTIISAPGEGTRVVAQLPLGASPEALPTGAIAEPDLEVQEVAKP